MRFSGVEISNVNGFHSSEESFLRHGCQSRWYSALLSDVLLPALRIIGPEGVHPAEVSLDSDGIPTEGRIAGWINANDACAYNCMHEHGQPDDVPWSLVYFVASGEDTAKATADQPTAKPADDGGALILTTRPGPSKQRSYLAITPTPGELWCFPGYMSHAVMPRELRKDVWAVLLGLGGGGVAQRGLRVSVACNVYVQSSPDRDYRIRHSVEGDEDLLHSFDRECALPSLSCVYR